MDVITENNQIIGMINFVIEFNSVRNESLIVPETFSRQLFFTIRVAKRNLTPMPSKNRTR